MTLNQGKVIRNYLDSLAERADQAIQKDLETPMSENVKFLVAGCVVGVWILACLYWSVG
jgi:hypothetical protein